MSMFYFDMNTPEGSNTLRHLVRKIVINCFISKKLFDDKIY